MHTRTYTQGGKGGRGGRKGRKEKVTAEMKRAARKAREEKREEKAAAERREREEIFEVGEEGMSLEQLADLLQVDGSDIVRALFMKGIMLSMNQVGCPYYYESVKLILMGRALWG
jgi:translation initiation factor IF-2